MTIIFASLTPVLITINYNGNIDSITLVSLVTALIVTASTSLVRTFKYYDNWINYRIICELLKKEKYYYDARIRDYHKTEDPQALFVDKIEDILYQVNKLSPSGSATGLVAQGEKFFVVVCPPIFQGIEQCQILVGQPTVAAIK